MPNIPNTPNTFLFFFTSPPPYYCYYIYICIYIYSPSLRARERAEHKKMFGLFGVFGMSNNVDFLCSVKCSAGKKCSVGGVDCFFFAFAQPASLCVFGAIRGKNAV